MGRGGQRAEVDDSETYTTWQDPRRPCSVANRIPSRQGHAGARNPRTASYTAWVGHPMDGGRSEPALDGDVPAAGKASRPASRAVTPSSTDRRPVSRQKSSRAATPATTVASSTYERVPTPGASLPPVDPEDFNRLVQSSKPYTYKVKAENNLLKRVGDKFYSYGNSLVRLREQFRKLDVDDSGKLDYSELRLGLANFGLSDKEVARLCATVDADGSGEVDYNEFMGFFEHYEPLDWGEAMTGKMKDKDDIMTAAPWKGYNKNKFRSWQTQPSLTTLEGDDLYEPGSYEEQQADMQIAGLLANKFLQREGKLRMIFRRFDEDKSGTIDIKEFKKAVRKMNLNFSDAALERFFRRCDTDGSGDISYEEFMDKFESDDPLAMMKSKEEYQRPSSRSTTATDEAAADAAVARVNASPVVAELRDKIYRSSSRAKSVFRQYDINGDGYLSHQELRKGLELLAPGIAGNEVDAIITASDPNNDGYLNYKEFLSFLEGKSQTASSTGGGPGGLGETEGAELPSLFGESPIPFGPRGYAPAAGSDRDVSRGSSVTPGPGGLPPRPRTVCSPFTQEPLIPNNVGAQRLPPSRPTSVMEGQTRRRSRSLTPAGAGGAAADRQSPYPVAGAAHRQLGRFAYTPTSRDTSSLIVPIEGTPSHASEAWHTGRTTSASASAANGRTSHGGRASSRLSTPSMEWQEADQAKKDQVLRGRSRAAAGHRHAAEVRARNSDTTADEKDRGKMEACAERKRRYVERMRLYDMGGDRQRLQGPGIFTIASDFSN